MRQAKVVSFPAQPPESDRVRLYRDEPCTILSFLSRLQAGRDATARKSVN